MKQAKRSFALLCAIALTLSLAIPALAVEPQSEVIDLGDGFYLVTTVTQYTTYSNDKMVYGSKSGDYYSGTTKIGTATLVASFDTSGSTAVAKTAVLTGSGMNGWSFKNGGTKCSGNKATGTPTFSSGSAHRSFTLTLTCSPSGVVS